MLLSKFQLGGERGDQEWECLLKENVSYVLTVQILIGVFKKKCV